MFSPENIFFCGYLDLKLFLQKEILLCLGQKGERERVHVKWNFRLETQYHLLWQTYEG